MLVGLWDANKNWGGGGRERGRERERERERGRERKSCRFSLFSMVAVVSESFLLLLAKT